MTVNLVLSVSPTKIFFHELAIPSVRPAERFEWNYAAESKNHSWYNRTRIVVSWRGLNCRNCPMLVRQAERSVNGPCFDRSMTKSSASKKPETLMENSGRVGPPIGIRENFGTRSNTKAIRANGICIDESISTRGRWKNVFTKHAGERIFVPLCSIKWIKNEFVAFVQKPTSSLSFFISVFRSKRSKTWHFFFHTESWI